MANLRRQPAPAPFSPVGGSAHSDTLGTMPYMMQATDTLGRSVAEIEVIYDHTTLWVNSPVRCLARYSGRGFEVNTKNGTPLSQRYGAITSNDWPDFRALVRHHLGIDLPTRPLVT